MNLASSNFGILQGTLNLRNADWIYVASSSIAVLAIAALIQTK